MKKTLWTSLKKPNISTAIIESNMLGSIQINYNEKPSKPYPQSKRKFVFVQKKAVPSNNEPTPVNTERDDHHEDSPLITLDHQSKTASDPLTMETNTLVNANQGLVHDELASVGTGGTGANTTVFKQDIAAVGTGGTGSGIPNPEIAAVGTGGTGSGHTKTIAETLLASIGGSAGLSLSSSTVQPPSASLPVTDTPGSHSIPDVLSPTNTILLSAMSDDFGEITGTLKRTSITDDSTPTFSGTVTDDAVSIWIYDNEELMGLATVDVNGQWTFTPQSPLSSGQHAFYAIAVDLAGNQSPHSDVWRITIYTSEASVENKLSLADLGLTDQTLFVDAQIDDLDDLNQQLGTLNLVQPIFVETSPSLTQVLLTQPFEVMLDPYCV